MDDRELYAHLEEIKDLIKKLDQDLFESDEPNDQQEDVSNGNKSEPKVRPKPVQE